MLSMPLRNVTTHKTKPNQTKVATISEVPTPVLLLQSMMMTNPAAALLRRTCVVWLVELQLTAYAAGVDREGPDLLRGVAGRRAEEGRELP